MSNKTKLLAIILAIASILAVIAVGSVVAQDNDDDTPPFGPMGHGMGMGMMGMMGWGFDGETPMHTAIAEALGIDSDTLWSELGSGKTIAELAEEKGVDLQVVKDAMTAGMTDHLNALVEAGYLTQEQADARLSAMQENMDLHLTTGCMGGGVMGQMHGGMGMGMHGGMMGQMHGGMGMGMHGGGSMHGGMGMHRQGSMRGGYWQ